MTARTPPDLQQILRRPIDTVLGDLAAFGPFEETVMEDDLHEGVPTEYWYRALESGIEIGCNDQRLVETVFLYVRPSSHFRAFRSSLPVGVSASDSREQVQERLGGPTKSGTIKSSLFRPGVWDRFDSADYCLHFEYESRGSRIRLVTIMTPERAP